MITVYVWDKNDSSGRIHYRFYSVDPIGPQLKTKNKKKVTICSKSMAYILSIEKKTFHKLHIEHFVTIYGVLSKIIFKHLVGFFLYIFIVLKVLKDYS